MILQPRKHILTKGTREQIAPFPMKTPSWLVQKAPSRFRPCSARAEWLNDGSKVDAVFFTNWNCPENLGWFQQIFRISTGQKSKFTNFEKNSERWEYIPQTVTTLEENIAVLSDLCDGESSRRPRRPSTNFQHRSLVVFSKQISTKRWHICRFFLLQIVHLLCWQRSWPSPQ